MRRLMAVLALLLLTGCAEDTTKPAAAPSSKAPNAACLPVSAAMLTALSEGAEKDVGKLTFTRGSAVLSPDFGHLYFIAARFTANGIGVQTGVWASSKLDTNGLITSVDNFAKQFTVWPDADKTQAKISTTDPSVDKARDCL